MSADLLAPLEPAAPPQQQSYASWVATLPCLKCFVVMGIRHHDCVAVQSPGGAEEHLLPICKGHRILEHKPSPAEEARGDAAAVDAGFWARPGIDAAAVAKALRSARFNRDDAKRVFEDERRRVLTDNKRGAKQ